MPTLAFQTEDVVNLAYLLAAVLFIVGLKMLGAVKTARRGNQISSLGMLLACVVTLFLVNKEAAPGASNLVSLAWVAVALLIGAAAGLLLAYKTPMTGMPQMVGLLNGFGGLASLLVACGDFLKDRPTGDLARWDELLAVGLTVLVGAVTFSGSMVAFGKLQGLKITPARPVLLPGHKTFIALLLLAALVCSGVLVAQPDAGWTVWLTAILALVLGVLLVIGIGGADMPVVICLLNSYSGIAGAFAGFVLNNQCLIITGALVGASGIILTNIMCKAMNRSLANVLFGGVGGEIAASAPGGAGAAPAGRYRTLTVEDVALQLDGSQLVIIVPGYGMAVAQAQHAVAELAEELESRSIAVRYAIHPVAGRMPGHMNVLLAEASVPYESMLDLDGSNAELPQAGVALVIGANDVTNPAARTNKASPIYGMPILNVDQARQVVVIKRSMNPGFAGVDNELYYMDNCGMLFGDGKVMAQALVTALKAM